MSHKYEVEGLRKRALVHLSSGYSTTSLRDGASIKDKQTWAHCGHYIPIISLARQVSADWIIPSALYRYCREMRVEEVITGVEFNGSIVRLSELDQVYALKASLFLRTDAISQVLSFLWSPSEIDGCTESPHCTLVRLQARRSAEWWRNTKRDHLMPFEIWQPDDFGQYLHSVCRVCLTEMRSTHTRALHSLWDKLPTLCGMSDWEALRSMKNLALK